MYTHQEAARFPSTVPRLPHAARLCKPHPPLLPHRELNLGTPFVGKPLLAFALAVSQSDANIQFAASADFSAQMRLP